MVRLIAPLVLFFIGAVFTMIGGAVVMFVARPMAESAEASKKWPTTPGTIIQSELDEFQDKEHGRMYRAIVVYKYSLDGGDFESNRIGFGGTFSTSDRSSITETLKKYPVGQTVDVIYNPDDPSESVLESAAGMGMTIAYGIGIGFLCVGGVFWVILAVAVYFLFFKPKAEASMFRNRTTSQPDINDEYSYRDPLAGDR